MNTEKAWYSYMGGTYHGDAPFFYDPEAVNWVKTIEDNYPVIKKELTAFMEHVALQDYFNTDLVKLRRSWKFGDFYFWGVRNHSYCRHIPEFEKILLSIPGFVTAGISVLAPNADINPHHGDTNTAIRGHLGLVVPAAYPVCGIGVGNQEQGWEEGKMLFFCDAHRHRAWNHSTQLRCVVLIDVLQEQFIPEKQNICTNVLSLINLQRLDTRFPWMQKLPGSVRGSVRMMLKLATHFKLG